MMESVISETLIYGPTTIYMEQHKVTSKFVFLSCCVIGEQLLGLYIFPQCLMGDIYARLCKMNASLLIKHSL